MSTWGFRINLSFEVEAESFVKACKKAAQQEAAARAAVDAIQALPSIEAATSTTTTANDPRLRHLHYFATFNTSLRGYPAEAVAQWLNRHRPFDMTCDAYAPLDFSDLLAKLDRTEACALFSVEAAGWAHGHVRKYRIVVKTPYRAERACVVCGADLTGRRAEAVTCGHACREEKHRQETRKPMRAEWDKLKK